MLISHTRSTPGAELARDELCWRIYHEGLRSDGGRYTYTEIGDLLDRHHSSIIHAVRRHEKRRHVK